MRLALIRQRYVAAGMERYDEAALEALLERSVAIALYTRSWPDTRLQLMEPVLVDPPYAGRFLRDWTFARAVCRAVRAQEPELVETDEPVPCCDFYRARQGVHATRQEQHARVDSTAARLLARADMHARFLRVTERAILTSPWLRAVTCPSAMVRTDIHRRFGVPPERLHVIPPSVDTDAFHPGLKSLRQWLRERHQVPDAAMLYLTVTDDYDHDGVPAVLAALARLPATAHLLVVGATSDMAGYQRLADALGVRERVVFAGPQVEPKPFYGAADVFVLPTLYQACARAALNAMACGLPVVTSPYSGIDDLVSKHDAGHVCDALDVPALAEAMRALQDPVALRRSGENARTAVMPLNPPTLTLRLVLVYRDLLQQSSTPAPQGGGTATGMGTGTGMGASAAASTEVLDPGGTASIPAAEVVVTAGASDAASEMPAEASDRVPVLDEPVPPDEVPPEVDASPAPASLDARVGQGPRG